MARRAYKILQEFRAVGERLLELVPEQYQKEVSSRDTLGQAWQRARETNIEGYFALQELSMLLDAKAGIERPDPSTTEQPRQYGLDSIVEVDGEARTIDDWCIEYENNPELVLQRIAGGWDPEEAIVVPAEPNADSQTDADSQNG